MEQATFTDLLIINIWRDLSTKINKYKIINNFDKSQKHISVM
jgi:hypothetical protein